MKKAAVKKRMGVIFKLIHIFLRRKENAVKLFSTNKRKRSLLTLLLVGVGTVCFSLCPSALAHVRAQQKQNAEQNPQSLTGKVVDSGGGPLIGASVLLKERQERRVTDQDGGFYFPVYTPGQHVEVNYIGFESMEQQTDSSGRIVMRLREDRRVLEEPAEIALLPPVEKEEKQPAGRPIPLGGEKEYKLYLQEKLIRPTDVECKDKTGNVIVLFSTDEDGRPYNIRIKKGLCSSCDHEAMRLVNEGSKWSHAAENIEISVHF